MPIFYGDTMINMGDITPDIYDNNFSITKSIILDDINFQSKIDLIKLMYRDGKKCIIRSY